MTTHKANIFDNIPDHLDQELFELLAKKGDVRIERIISKGHTSPESSWHDQEQDEWVILLEGAATLTFEEGDNVQLRQGDHLLIPAHRKHKVSWTDPETPSIWLAIHF